MPAERSGPSRLRRLAHRTSARVRTRLGARRHGVLFVARRSWRARDRRPARQQRAAVAAPASPCPTVGLAGLDPASASVHEVHPLTRIDVRYPDDLDPWLRGAPGWHEAHGVTPQSVVELRDGCVLGADGWVGPSPDVVCTDLNQGINVGRTAICRAAAAARALGEERLPGTTVSLLVSGATNYYHWMLQALPMLSVLLERIDPTTVDRFLVPGPTPPFVTETLARAGLPGDRLRPVAAPTPVLRCDRLITASTLLHHLPSPPWATAFVRGLFADEIAAGGEAGDRLHVGRGPGVRRRVLLNEPALVAALRSAGFQDVVMDGRTVAEQAECFAAARVVVAVHGAALTNLVFCRPGTRVVELLPANAAVSLYSLLSIQLGLDHRVVVGTEARPPRRFRTFMADADLRVDVDRVVREATGVAA